MAPVLARFVRSCAAALDRTPLETFAAGEVEFPEPDAALAKSGARNG
jgi:hypothetical protein